MIIVDRQGRVVFVYSESGTNIKGVYERWKQYDNYKDNVEQGHVKAQDLKEYHVRTMTERGYTVHLRPLLFMGASRDIRQTHGRLRGPIHRRF